MGENKGQTIFLSVIGIATLLVAIIGATFAYFTTTMDKSNAVTGNVSTGSISQLKLTSATVDIGGTNVMPGWTSETAQFTISGTITGNATVPYTCSVTTTGDAIADLQYAVSTDGGELGTWTNLSGVTNPIVSGAITAANPEDVYKFAVRFKETGVVQNQEGATDQSGKSTTVKVECETSADAKYSDVGGVIQED